MTLAQNPPPPKRDLSCTTSGLLMWCWWFSGEHSAFQTQDYWDHRQKWQELKSNDLMNIWIKKLPSAFLSNLLKYELRRKQTKHFWRHGCRAVRAQVSFLRIRSEMRTGSNNSITQKGMDQFPLHPPLNHHPKSSFCRVQEPLSPPLLHLTKLSLDDAVGCGMRY
jgi:hypothetical protein